MRILLVRHPRVLIRPGICYGRLDIPIDPAAAADMAELATTETLESAKRVWTSPALRCDIQAEAIARNWLIPKIADPRLQELDFGSWEGKAWDEVPRADLDRWAANLETFRPPDGESGMELIARCKDFHAEICRAGDDCSIVSHGGPLIVLNALFSGKPIDLRAPRQPTGSISTVIVCP